MSDTNNYKNMRFSNEQDISRYPYIVYKVGETIVKKNGGITCIGTTCMCIDKTKCDCLIKLKKFIYKNR